MSWAKRLNILTKYQADFVLCLQFSKFSFGSELCIFLHHQLDAFEQIIQFKSKILFPDKKVKRCLPRIFVSVAFVAQFRYLDFASFTGRNTFWSASKVLMVASNFNFLFLELLVFNCVSKQKILHFDRAVKSNLRKRFCKPMRHSSMFYVFCQ